MTARASIAAVVVVAAVLLAGGVGAVQAGHMSDDDGGEQTPTPTAHTTPTPTEHSTPEPTPEPTRTPVSEPTPTPTPEPTATATASSSRERTARPPRDQGQAPARTPDDPDEIVAEVDEDIRVTDYGYDEGNSTFWVAFEHVGDRSSRVTITEAISDDQAGAGTFGIEQVRLQEGEQAVVHVSVNPRASTKGVMITTSKSIAKGQGTYLQIDESMSLFDFSASWWTARIVWLFGVTATVSAFLVGAWALVASRREDVADADLDPEDSAWGGLR